jgi:hypothetical protein
VAQGPPRDDFCDDVNVPYPYATKKTENMLEWGHEY